MTDATIEHRPRTLLDLRTRGRSGLWAKAQPLGDVSSEPATSVLGIQDEAKTSVDVPRLLSGPTDVDDDDDFDASIVTTAWRRTAFTIAVGVVVAWFAAGCASDPDPATLQECWTINDAAIERCVNDLPCRHAAYKDEIARCFDEAGCDALAAWLRCAGAAQCPPGECAQACATKPGECPRP